MVNCHTQHLTSLHSSPHIALHYSQQHTFRLTTPNTTLPRLTTPNTTLPASPHHTPRFTTSHSPPHCTTLSTQFSTFCWLIGISFHTADDRMAGDLPRRQLRKSECAERVLVADFVWLHFEGSIVELVVTKLSLDLIDLLYMVTEI